MSKRNEDEIDSNHYSTQTGRTGQEGCIESDEIHKKLSFLIEMNLLALFRLLHPQPNPGVGIEIIFVTQS